MALYTSKGRISDMSEVQSGVSKNGYNWQRMTIVLDVPGFQGSVTKQAFQVSGDSVNDVLLFSIGDKVEISWTLYAREWNGKWYNSADLVKIKNQETGQPAPAPQPAAPVQAAPQPHLFNNTKESLNPAENPDDLPF